ncbi:MAG TPA: metallophosphoesterase [Candidatus Limnocylindrales bacterium]
MTRIAAVGDVHMDVDVLGRFRPALDTLDEHADMLLLAGDLTRHGTAEEARCVAQEFGGLPVPVIAVLGNHDYHSNQEAVVIDVLAEAGITVLEGNSTFIECDGEPVGIAGAKGFGGGFAGRCASAFGEPAMKAFVRHTEESAESLSRALKDMGTRCKVALTHYAPVPETLAGEPLEIYPFLGSYLLAEAIDTGGATLSIHGHAHHGSPRGMTPGGVRVRNVAHPVIRQAYSVFAL